ncbi:single-stranded DNA-binding protein [Actinocorallia aurea]
MDEALTTVVGWVAKRPLLTLTRSGIPFLSLRVGVTPARYDRATGRWVNGEPTFFGVTCWRGLAENVHASDLVPGTPVIVQGRLRVREYEREGEHRLSVILEALALGHDLNRGTAHFQRVLRTPSTQPDLTLEQAAPPHRADQEDHPNAA